MNQPIQKAWEINFSKIEEGYLYSDTITYAENRNKAKSNLMAYADDMVLKETGESPNYLNIPVKRCNHLDKILFEGNFLTKLKISEVLSYRERISKLQELLNDSSITHCYIKKGSYYRPNSCGYTDMKHRAGVYTKQDAFNSAISCRDIDLIPININEHNAMIQKEIDELSSRLIK